MTQAQPIGDNEQDTLRALVAFAGGAGSRSSLLKILPQLSPRRDVAAVYLASEGELDGDEAVAEIAKLSPFPTQLVSASTQLQPGTLYLLRQGAEVSYTDGSLSVLPREDSEHPIDAWFDELARFLGPRVLAVLLSGRQMDGGLGLLAVKAEDGVTLGESETALHPEMPAAALHADALDYVLTADALGPEISRLLHHAYLDGSTLDPVGVSEFLPRILELLRQHHTVDFTPYKHSSVRRRVLRRMMLLRCENLERFFFQLKASPEALESLYQDLSISVTSLFRDNEVFQALSERVLPSLLERTHGNEVFRVWVAGCSRGDEVYSLAIALQEVMKKHKIHRLVQIFGTDINEVMLEKARRGFYSESIADSVSVERLRTFFVPVEGGYQICKAIRDQCLFARQDLTRDPPFSRIDLISCRNVLIYLNPTLQQKLLRVFHYSLKPNGALLLGVSESVGRASDFFQPHDRVARVFARRSTPTPLPLDVFDAGSRFTAERSEREVVHSRVMSGGGSQEVQREADRLALSRYAPAGVVLDSDLQVIQYRGRTGAYLEQPAGIVTHNVLKMAREGLLADLMTALSTAKDTGQPCSREALQVRTHDDWSKVDLDVLPFSLTNHPERYYLVVFRPSRLSAPSAPERSVGPDEGAAAPADLTRLRDELAATREYLYSINQEQEATLESLQAANEEIQSANEEMQSTNEELETAKEELQSTNEELTTVNEELQERNLELTRVNNDLTNLLSSVNIPLIIVGADMRIRRFTPMARQVLNVIASDVGRPMGDLRPQLEVPDLEEKVQEVLDTLFPLELEVQDKQGRSYLVRIRPYRTQENQIDGAVIAFLDVSELRSSASSFHEARDLTRSLLEAWSEPMLLVDSELRVFEASSRFLSQFGLKGQSIVGRPLADLGEADWNAPAVLLRLGELLRDLRTGAGGVQRIATPSIRGVQRVMLVRSTPIGGAPGLLLSFEELHQSS